jgi:hypothetical protein
VAISRLSANDRLAALSAVVVLVTGLVSVLDDWGAILVLAILAAVGALGVILAPQLAPTARLPGSKGSLLLIAGVVAALSWIVAAVAWLDWIVSRVVDIYTIQFLVGLAATALLAWTGWVALSAEGGTLQLGLPTPAGAGGAGMDPPASGPSSPTPTSSAPVEPAAPPSAERDPHPDA